MSLTNGKHVTYKGYSVFSHLTILVAFASFILSTNAASITFGSAVVLNKCAYPVNVVNTPPEESKYSILSTTLNSSQIYSQQYIPLPTGGWSIKLSHIGSDTNIMQFEYNVQPKQWGGVVWYDISYVNGDPWDGDWSLAGSSVSGRCQPDHRAYLYPTDDAHGMQASCPVDSIITVALCSENNGTELASVSGDQITSSQPVSTSSVSITVTKSASASLALITSSVTTASAADQSISGGFTRSSSSSRPSYPTGTGVNMFEEIYIGCGYYPQSSAIPPIVTPTGFLTSSRI